MDGSVGVAIVGCGYWGVNYVRVFSELADSRVVVVCDAREDRLREIGRWYPTVKLTTRLEEALACDGVDAVIVCTNAHTHHDVTRRALAAGKHVLVEKPLTTVSADAEELIEIAEATSTVLMVGHTFVYNAGVRKVKELVEQAPDQVYYLYSSRTNLGPIRGDVNALWDLAPHDVAIFNFLLDSEPEWVSAVGARVLRNCREDVGFITLGYEHEVLGHIHVSWADPYKSREVVVVGSERRIVFNDLNGLEQVRVFEKGVKPVAPELPTFGEHRMQIHDGGIVSPKVEVSEPLKNQCRHFLDCVTRGVSPITDGRSGEEVVRVLEAVDKSLKRHGAPVEVASSQRRRSHRDEQLSLSAQSSLGRAAAGPSNVDGNRRSGTDSAGRSGRAARNHPAGSEWSRNGRAARHGLHTGAAG